MSKPFITPDFLLYTETARKLYHEHSENLPIIDYHCHLSPKEIAENKPFESITDLWLSGDHYKWRAMRANGIEIHNWRCFSMGKIPEMGRDRSSYIPQSSLPLDTP